MLTDDAWVDESRGSLCADGDGHRHHVGIPAVAGWSVMEFTRTDLMIVIGMSLAVIGMSFTFPALGLTDESDEVNESDVPDFNITDDRFNFIDEFPDNPGTPSQGYIRWDSRIGSDSLNQRWLHGDTQGGTEIVLLNDGNASDPEADIGVLNWTDGNSVQDEYFLQDVGDIETHDNFSYRIRFEFDRIDHHDDGDNSTMVVQYNIIEQPSDEAWYARVPVLGQVVGAGSQIAGVVAYGFTVIWWAVATGLEIVLNLAGMLFDVMAFVIATLHWLTTTYTSVISAADDFAAVFITLPGLILGYELGKLVWIGISLLPTT